MNRINKVVFFFNFFIGIQMGSCGDVAVRFRPALIFAEKHAHIVLDKMTEVAKKF
jgi:4-aminobutyrate aminotransferase/(S)-3-amino-2-methylpropionate transaminase